MQDPSTYFNQFPEHEILKCPRCDSSNTKFCYYNNYNLSQPRHYCKNCKRYWTKGGTLRNIPVGGASRKITKRSSSSSSKRPTTSSPPPPDSNTQQQQQTSYLSGFRVDPKLEERFPGLESGDMNSWSGSNSDWPDIYNTQRGGSGFQ
ncbi:unnamed protein product [Rhodiola kirilowii]